jgi:hypothetical protein
MRPAILSLAALLLSASASAQQPGVPAPEAAAAAPSAAADAPAGAEPRVNQLIVYGDDPCPQSTDEEIIVCAHLPEGDRYRIPPNLRDNPNDPANQSWANRAVELSYVGRTGTDSCSTVGGGGFTGCLNQIFQQVRAERRGGEQVNWNALIEQARRERLGHIDEEAAEAEAQSQAEQPPQ